jgi:hypothetical protein
MYNEKCIFLARKRQVFNQGIIGTNKIKRMSVSALIKFWKIIAHCKISTAVNKASSNSTTFLYLKQIENKILYSFQTNYPV